MSVHMKAVNITEFRKNLFRLIDETLATGEPILINRKGRRVIVRGEKPGRVDLGETEEEREARWRKFWAAPPEIDEDLSLEEIEAAGESYWRFSETPTLDR